MDLSALICVAIADELTYVLGRWKIDLESAWEEFTEKDWR